MRPFTLAKFLPVLNLVHAFDSKFVANFTGSWTENIAVRSNGDILVTTLSPSPYLYAISPSASTSATLVANLTSYGMTGLLGITETTPGQFYFIGGALTADTGFTGNGTYGIYGINLARKDAAMKKIMDISNATLLNGLATISVKKNLLVASDTMGGAMYLIDIAAGTSEVLISDETTRVMPGVVNALGINGIRVLQTLNKDEVYIYYSNTGAKSVYRVPFSVSKLKTIGPVKLLVNETSVDDFAIDVKLGVLWLAGRAENKVLNVSLNGSTPVLVANGAAGSTFTSCAVGRGACKNSVFCTTTVGTVVKIGVSASSR